jgi:hypothetical protein
VDWVFLVYLTQAYLGLKPYLKGFHLLFETWRGDRDSKGWKVKTHETNDNTSHVDMEDIKIVLLTEVTTGKIDGGGVHRQASLWPFRGLRKT